MKNFLDWCNWESITVKNFLILLDLNGLTMHNILITVIIFNQLKNFLAQMAILVHNILLQSTDQQATQYKIPGFFCTAPEDTKTTSSMAIIVDNLKENQNVKSLEPSQTVVDYIIDLSLHCWGVTQAGLSYNQGCTGYCIRPDSRVMGLSGIQPVIFLYLAGYWIPNNLLF